MTTFQNDIEAAVEVDCGSGWVVLYPKQRLQIAGSAESLSIRLREDYTISSHVYIHAEAGLFSSEMCTSELGPFNIQAERWLEREKMSVALAEAHALLRKVRDARARNQDTLKHAKAWFKGGFVFALLYGVFTLTTAVLTLTFAPELMMKGWVGFCSLSAVCGWTLVPRQLGYVARRYGTATSHILLWSIFIFVALFPYVIFMHAMCLHEQYDYWECMIAVVDMTDFIPLFIVPVGLTIHILVRRFHKKLAVHFYPDLLEKHVAKRAFENSIVFHGRVLEGKGRACVCSWPGKYAPAWDAMVRSSKKGNTSAAVVFLPEGCELFGLHDPIPEAGELKDVRGKAQSFGTCGSEHLRRETLWRRRDTEEFLSSALFQDALNSGLEELSKGKREDSSSQYSREKDRLFLHWLPPDDRHLAVVVASSVQFFPQDWARSVLVPMLQFMIQTFRGEDSKGNLSVPEIIVRE
ncbi:unnamed protein product [Symbiodinium microadriaticum]|nr:unnamed protein product [Symbiodinium microadriaticum]